MPLIIGDKKINKISGPVSMFILKPKVNELFPNLPLYMLFGDMHNSSENMCGEDVEDETVVNVYDIKFLQALNSLCTKERPIDFYVEGGDIHNKKYIYTEPGEEGLPLNEMWSLYMDCYRYGQVPKYEHKTDCKSIEKVRWQSADARNFLKFWKRCNMYTFLQEIDFKLKDDSNEDEEDEDEDEEDEDEDEEDEDSFKLPYKTSVYDPIKFKKVLTSLRQSENSEYCLNKIALQDLTSLDDFIFQEDGLVMKQLNKIKNVKQRDELIKYIKTFCRLITKSIIEAYKKYIPILLKIDRDLKHIIISGEIDNKFLERNWDKVALYHYFLESKHTILLDVYTICRSFKHLLSEQIGEPKPIMNILYAGHDHIKNVIYFLKSVSKLYTVEFKSDYINTGRTHDANRCIEIKDDINLDILCGKV
jgi:hypothetical protein